MSCFDWDGEAHTFYEAEPGAIVLIRPDGYIGFRGAPGMPRLCVSISPRFFQARIYTSGNPGYL